MKRISSEIEITLKSDLCVSSGQAYAGVIDTDSCFDKNGFPYIPAKRLKGIMREAAEMLGYKADKYFGAGGSGIIAQGEHCIYLKDAILEETSEVNREISDIKIHDKGTCLTEQNITNLFSSIKAQTKLDKNGAALENTLRFTRTVNQYMPACFDDKQKEIKFVAKIDYGQEDHDEINNIVKAVRHIGMDRTRGLGNVKCILRNHKTDIKAKSLNLSPKGNSDVLSIIRYKLTNTSPLILSMSKDDVTEKYIGGQVILGALANLYLKIQGISEPDQVFNSIFLSGESIFNNLYISDYEGNEYVPAPLFINRLKKTKKYVCTAKSSDDNGGDYCPNNGNQPKKLNGKYVLWDEENVTVIEPQTDLVYHHSKRESYDPGRMGDDAANGILYSQEVLKENQIFAGSIIVKEKYADIIQNLLESDMLRIGKSKSAQYGHCQSKLLAKETYNDLKIELKQGERIFIVLESDCIVPGKYGYTTDCENVQKYLAEHFKLKEIQEAKIYMNTKVVTGYNGKMNMKKSSIPAITAGSAFEFEVPKTGTYKIGYIGSYNADGYGKTRVIKEDDLSYRMNETVFEERKTSSEDRSSMIQALEQEISKKQILEGLKINFIENFANKNIGISSSLLGRVTLMLKESQSADDILTDFASRIASIKRDKERNEIISKLKAWNICKIELEKDEKKNWKLKKVENIISNESAQSLWIEYLTFILLHMKYMKSERTMANGGKQNE